MKAPSDPTATATRRGQSGSGCARRGSSAQPSQDDPHGNRQVTPDGQNMVVGVALKPGNPKDDLMAPVLSNRPPLIRAHAPYVIQSLSDASLIGVMGDLHGDLEHALQAFRTFATRGVRVILQLGDFGVLWPGENWKTSLDKLSRALGKNAQSLYWVEGNHDWHPKIDSFPVDPDGTRWIGSNIAHLPRGYRTEVGGRFMLAALGGANSSDRSFRREGEDWWPEEQIRDGDLHRLGNEPADVLVGHEAPLVDEVDLNRRAMALGLSSEEAAYARASRTMFRKAVLQVRPRLTLGGHYHRFIDQTLPMPGAPTGETRVVVLDMNGRDRVNLAVMDTKTLALEFFYRNGAPARRGDGLPP
jgi:hypothetical protein